MKRLFTHSLKQRITCGVVTLLVLLPVSGFAQLITTYAGGYVPVDGAQAVTQAFEGISAVTSDHAGGFYFSTFGPEQHRVYRVSFDGILTAVAGAGSPGFSGDGGPALSAQLNNPSGLVVDGSGSLFIADSANNRIRKVTPTGTISTVAGTAFTGFGGDGGPATSARLNYPRDVALDAAGALLISDAFNYRIRKVSAAGVISTIAGIGQFGSSGDGGPATSARLSSVQGIAVDASGNVLIADTGNHRIRRVNPEGVIQTVVGNGGFTPFVDGGSATGTATSSPSDVAVDAVGNILIATLSNRIRRVDLSGIVSTVAGTGGAGFSGDGGAATLAQLNSPGSVAVDASGVLFIVDTNNLRIRKVNAAGVISTAAGNGGVGDGGTARLASLSYPTSLAMDSSGNLYVADTGHNRIRKVSASGTVSSVFTGTSLAAGIGVDASGNVYYSDCIANIFKVTPQGAVSTLRTTDNWGFCDFYDYYGYTYFSGGPKGGFAFDANGNLVVASTYLSRIQRVAPNGQISPVAGTGASGFEGDGGPAADAQFREPWGLAIDTGGNLFVADTSNHRIRKITSNGVISTVAGSGVAGSLGDNGPATLAQLNGPSGLAIDPAGNLYIADTFNNRIRKVTPAGVISTVAGTGISGAGGDGGLALSAQLNSPTGLAFDAAGNLFVGDSGNNRIRRIGFVPTVPTLASLSTNTGILGSNVNVTLSGTSLTSPLTVDAGSGVTASGITVINETLATATFAVAPNAALGVRNVNVTTSLGTSGSIPFTVVGPYPDLSIFSTHEGNFGVGFDAAYAVFIFNRGVAATASPMIVTDELPEGFTYVAGAGSGWSCSSAQQVVTCVRPDPLPPGESTKIDLKVDVGENAASAVVHAPKIATDGDITASNNSFSDTTAVAVPVVNARFTPQFFVAGDQGTVDLTLPVSFPRDVHGTLTLGFTPDAIHSADDPALQFSTGGRNVAFTIPANTVRARFGSNTAAGPIGFQAGTIAGNISFNGTLQTGNVETAFSSQTTIPKHPPKIHSVQRESTDGNNFLLGVRLTSSPREVTQLALRFFGSQTRFSCGAVAGCSANGNTLTLDVRSMFDTWFSADTLNGSASILHLPLYIDANNWGAIEINLMNRFGTSNSVRYTLP